MNSALPVIVEPLRARLPIHTVRYSYYLRQVSKYVCLFVCLLAGLCKNYGTPPFFTKFDGMVKVKVKVKVHTLDIAPLRSETPLHTHTFIHNRNEPYLPLPSKPQLVPIYRPRRDGRLSRPWCKVAWPRVEPATSRLQIRHSTTQPLAHLGGTWAMEEPVRFWW